MSVILRVGAVKPNGNQELLYGSSDEPSSYSDADVLDIPLPEHTYQRPLPPTTTDSHSVTGYIGLPYQDHNYGMPPPPSPPKPPTPRPLSPFEDSVVVQMEEEVKTTPLVSVVEEVVEDSITRCICGYLHDDGYMICCDKCSVWQHIDCMGVDRNNIPDNYFCELCQPRVLDAVKAKAMQKRKREELAARNVLSDSSATDTDPEEAANAMASLGKKLPANKKKSLKQKRTTKAKEKPPLKLKIKKSLAQKVVKPSKKEKENVTSPKSPKKAAKIFETQIEQTVNLKKKSPLTFDEVMGDPWNSNFSPWIDSYDHIKENVCNPSVTELCVNSGCASRTDDVMATLLDKPIPQLACVAEVKKNRKGLRTLQQISAGQAIIEFKGKVMLKHDYDKEHGFVNIFKRLQPFVLFYSKLDVDLCVDARLCGNEARFVRRSCTPNAEVKHIFSDGILSFVILSKKDIMCGFEVTIAFDYNHKDCSFCVECACKKTNCVVSKHWKKLKNSQKVLPKENGTKGKRQSYSVDPKILPSDNACMSPPCGSPYKNLLSPVKSPGPASMSSPVKLSNVSTLLAASALLDDLANQGDLDVIDPMQISPASIEHKSLTCSRRSSRASVDSVEEKSPHPSSPTKDKTNKLKDNSKSNSKEKDKVSVPPITEIKRERKLSSRRESHDDVVDTTDRHDLSSNAHSSGTEADESTLYDQKKMTREERKLDAIMKAFEKLEKREEKRKEAIARDPGSKRSVTDSKVTKRDHPGQDESQDGVAGIKEEPSTCTPDAQLNNHTNSQKSSPDADVKLEKCEDIHEKVPQSSGFLTHHDSRIGSLDSSLKTSRKPGKRKRRRSRAHSTATILSEPPSLSTDESNNSSCFPVVAPMSVPVTPLSTPTSTSLPSEDDDGGIFKYVKTKKHLFDEWSHKHEDEAKQEMFVQCLPNPHVNTMDHLQRRNSQSGYSGTKGSDAGGGSAKKRWLRQAMHEVPAPVSFNHSLSVSTDSGSASPVHGSSSPNPGAGLGSPGAGSPLDFVTPLKKRRLMRESLNSETMVSPSAGIHAESCNSSEAVGNILSKPNGLNHNFPPTRHSTDDVRQLIVIPQFINNLNPSW